MPDTEDIALKKYNLRLYPIYKMFSWDMLFFYAISFMFLTTVKNLDASQVLFIDAIYTFLKAILQIPLVAIIEKIGKRKSLIIGNIAIAIHTFLLIVAPNISIVILASAFCAVRICF